MSKGLQVYQGDGIVVTFDPNVCIHSAVCLRTLPEVFDVSRARWIDVEKGETDAIAAAVAKCPSGALQSVRAGKTTPGSSTIAAGPVEVTVRPNGPLLIRGRVRVTKESGEVVEKESCALCRCGATGTAPFCDGSHNRIGFKSPS
jgi:uncharacterized Fe-S cluster protein YjdI